MTKHRRTSRGFTLIELVLVMLIIGLMLAVIAPSMGGLLRSQQLDQSARMVAAMLREARVHAAGQAKPCRLVIDTEDNTCWLEILTPEGFERLKSRDTKEIELGDKLLIEMDGGTIEDGLLTIRIEPDGVGELAQITLTREIDNKQIAVYCRTPTEPYRIGPPLSPTELKRGADDVDLYYE